MHGVAVEQGAGLVPVNHPAFAVITLYGNPWRLFEQQAKALLAFAQGTFITLLRADVLYGAKDAAISVDFAAQHQPGGLLGVALQQACADHHAVVVIEQGMQSTLRGRAFGGVQPTEQLFRSAR